jgi:putative phosphoesterase
MTLVGLISDTHGLLRPEAAAALQGVSQILHAGDVGKSEILEALAAIAPVTAVRGNVDSGTWAMELPLRTTVMIAGHAIHMRHIPGGFQLEPEGEPISAVVWGHTHQPLIETRGRLLCINPGSAGPRRFALPVSIGFLRLSENKAPEAWLQTLDV